jgi:ABC-type dipeptide/oligopeptide/nickel transport system permease subunit
MTRTRTAVFVFVFVLAAVTLLGLGAPELLAQSQGMPQTGLASQSLRPYWHVFIAYTIAIALVLGWVISIGRRLRDVEDRLGQG